MAHLIAFCALAIFINFAIIIIIALRCDKSEKADHAQGLIEEGKVVDEEPMGIPELGIKYANF